MRGEWKIIAVALVVTLAVRALTALLPESVVLPLFCMPPARFAAFYYGVGLDAEAIAFTAHGLTVAVTRACAATDFFSLVCGLFAARFMVARRARGLAFAALAPCAYLVAIAANSLRLVALVPVDAAFGADAVPLIHLVAGASVFLTVFIILFHALKFPRLP